MAGLRDPSISNWAEIANHKDTWEQKIWSEVNYLPTETERVHLA